MTNKNKFQKFALVLYIICVIILFVLFSSVLIKTAQRGDSLSSTGDFSRDGVMDYETTEQNDTSEQDTEGSYELIQGVNGQYEYRCTKICSEECGRACDTCLMNGKSFKRSPKCCFDYSAWCCIWTRPRPTSMWTSCLWQRSRAGASQRGYQ